MLTGNIEIANLEKLSDWVEDVSPADAAVRLQIIADGVTIGHGRKRKPDSAVAKKTKATRDGKKKAAPVEKLPEPPVQSTGRARLIAKRVVGKKSANSFRSQRQVSPSMPQITHK
jgi:hypothetical protein